MKFLLITDIPPCKDFTAGLVLDQLCRFLPRGSIACFAVVNPGLQATLTADLDWIPIAYTRKRNENAFVRLPGLFGFPFRFLFETLRRTIVVPRLTKQAVDFGRKQGVTAVWVVLQGQTVVQMAAEVAQRLGVPLYTQVWDPLIWWLVANHIDRFNRRKALADFDKALRSSRACAAASWAMADHYQRRYDTYSTPVISSHSPAIAAYPELGDFPGDEIVIGMAGQFYAGQEWLQLVRALNMAGWQVDGHNVSVLVLGPSEPPGEAPLKKISYLGWHSQADAIQILAKCHILYCPYPFAQNMAEVVELSFPSKVALYLAAGRPVLFHGPQSASPAISLESCGAGEIVDDVHAAAIYNGLWRLVADPIHYQELGKKAQAAFLRDFTTTAMRENFGRFLAGGDTNVHASLMEVPDALPSPPVFYPDVRSFLLIPLVTPFFMMVASLTWKFARDAKHCLRRATNQLAALCSTREKGARR
jgi:glycosyltransferase involved in cell wall biosynthesis